MASRIEGVGSVFDAPLPKFAESEHAQRVADFFQ